MSDIHIEGDVSGDNINFGQQIFHGAVYIVRELPPDEPATCQTRIFVSYARADDDPDYDDPLKSFLRRLYNHLTAAGFAVWWDRVSLPSRSLEFTKEIEAAIRACERFVLVAGPGAAVSDYVRAEWRFATAECKPITPILRVGDYDTLPVVLRDINTIDCRPARDEASAFGDLTARLLQDAPIGAIIGLKKDLPDGYLLRETPFNAARDAICADAINPTVISAPPGAVALFGLGGVGKSTLATALARDCQVRRHYRDGVLWVEVGQTPQIVSLQQAVGVMLGDDHTNYQDANSATLSLSRTLRQKAALIVLDDVWDHRLVQHFPIIGTACRLLVTTRNQTLADHVQGADIRLDTLTPDEGARLISNLTTSTPDDPLLRQISEKLGGHTLAVTLAARQIANGYAADTADLLRLLEKHEQWTEPFKDLTIEDTDKDLNLALSLALSYKGLPGDDLRRRFRQTGAFPLESIFDRNALAAVWGDDDPDSTRRPLQILTGAGLLDAAPGEGRYSQHRLLCIYARALLAEAGELDMARAQHFDFYFNSIQGGTALSVDYIVHYNEAFKWTTRTRQRLFFDKLLPHLQQKAALWGSLHTFLLDLLQTGSLPEVMELVLCLACADNQSTRDLLVFSLNYYGIDNLKAVETVINQMIISTQENEIYRQTEMAERIRVVTIEASYHIRLMQVLEQGLRDPSQIVQKVAMQRLITLFHDNHSQAYYTSVDVPEPARKCIFHILEKAAQELSGTGRLARHTSLALTVLLLSGSLWFSNFQDQETVNRLRAIWRIALNQLLIYRRPGQRGYNIERIRVNLRRIELIALMIIQRGQPLKRFVSLIGEAQTDDNQLQQTGQSHWLNFEEINAFFETDTHTRDSIREIISYLDNDPKDINHIEPQLLELAHSRDVLTWYIMTAVLTYHCALNPEKAFPVLCNVFETAFVIIPPPPPIVTFRDPLRFALSANTFSTHPDWFNQIKDMTWRFWDIHLGHFTTSKRSYSYGGWEAYQHDYYREHQTLDWDIIERIINKMQNEPDNRLLLLETLLGDIRGLMGYQSVPNDVALSVLNRILKVKQHGDDILFVRFIASYRSIDGKAVDRFVDENPYITTEMREQIRSRTVEDFTKMLSSQVTAFVIKHLIDSQKVRTIIQDLVHILITTRWFAWFLIRLLGYVLQLANDLLTDQEKKGGS